MMHRPFEDVWLEALLLVTAVVRMAGFVRCTRWELVPADLTAVTAELDELEEEMLDALEEENLCSGTASFAVLNEFATLATPMTLVVTVAPVRTVIPTTEIRLRVR